MPLRLVIAAVLVVAAALLCIGCGRSGGCVGGPGVPCKAYVTCYEATGGVKGTLDTSYGAMANCWLTTNEIASACCDTCTSALEGLRRAHPDAGC